MNRFDQLLARQDAKASTATFAKYAAVLAVPCWAVAAVLIKFFM